MKRIIVSLVSLILMLGLVGVVSADTINVPGDYLTIQAAIDEAISGDTINVAAGTYNEEVNINKPLTLLGEDKDTTIIDGGGVRWGAIDITADYVTVSGFTIHNRGHSQSMGVYILEDFTTYQGGHHCEISGNVIDANNYAIRIYTNRHSGYNLIENNIITGDYNGIQLEYTLENTVKGNVITGASGWAGINLMIASDNNIIERNDISDCKYGISMVGSQGGVSGNVIQYNTITGCTRGIWWQRNPANTIEYNNIYNNTEHNVYAGFYFIPEDPAPVENNWWGTDPPEVAKFYGNVDYDPWLDSFYSLPITEVWVDDNWNSQADVDDFDPNLTWQYDAFDKIQDGIDAVAEGGTVNVAAGTYTVPGQLIVDDGKKLIADPNAATQPEITFQSTYNQFNDGAELRGLKITCTSGQGGNVHINVFGDGSKVEDNYLECGFRFYGSSNAVVRGNTIKNCAANFIDFRGDNCHDNVFENNIVEDAGCSVWEPIAIELGAYNNIVTGNTVNARSNCAAIQIFDPVAGETACGGNTISFNTVTNADQSGSGCAAVVIQTPGNFYGCGTANTDPVYIVVPGNTEIPCPVTGDLDGDGDVDYEDYLIFRTTYRSCIGDANFVPAADLDGDGCVTINDYRIFRSLI